MDPPADVNRDVQDDENAMHLNTNYCGRKEDSENLPLDDTEEERKHFLRIISAFRYYKVHSLKRVALALRYFNELPAHHRELLPRFKTNLSDIRVCIEHNYEIVKLLIACTDDMFESKQNGNNSDDRQHGVCAVRVSMPPEFDMDKVRSTLKQFVRDWSTDGQEERNACYKPVIDELLRLYPGNLRNDCESSRAGISVLVPGAGLGRLAFEIARLGYHCQGNEFSLFMLFASNFVLNRCKTPNALTLYPWVHQFCNNITSSAQTHCIRFPDINPSDLPPSANFSMAAGDFLEIYTEPDTWDCVATVFFIDTAHNIISYIETIYRILKPGAYWINFGPLLYHFADMPNESSIELSYDEVKQVILKFNFEILKEEVNVPATYTQEPNSMLRYQYNCVFFVARKPLSPATESPSSPAQKTDEDMNVNSVDVDRNCYA